MKYIRFVDIIFDVRCARAHHSNVPVCCPVTHSSVAHAGPQDTIAGAQLITSSVIDRITRPPQISYQYHNTRRPTELSNNRNRSGARCSRMQSITPEFICIKSIPRKFGRADYSNLFWPGTQFITMQTHLFRRAHIVIHMLTICPFGRRK